MSDKPTPEQTVIPSLYITFHQMATRIARDHGYALGLHGSMRRDLDLIAVPWIFDAQPPERLARAIYERTSGQASSFPFERIKPVRRPHRRMCWALPVGSSLYLDLSIIEPDRLDLVERVLPA